jgi:rhamnogalacturonyl hydrolase YesR
MYVRTGDSKYLAAAYHAANFVREHTRLDGPDAGIFTLKGPDLKYVYPRAMHIHYLLTGDDRALACGKVMAEYCFNTQHPVYRPDLIKPVPLNVDPERGRNFWTLRHQGYGLLGTVHGWEMTGEKKYWTKARECVDAYYKHQLQPPDGRPPDGSLRQNWELYDPNEATFPGATSAWMMALLLDPLFHYWTLTNDRRVAHMVVKWCDFLDRQGIVPDGSKAYYVINCFAANDPKAPRGEIGPDMEMHNTEMAYTFALGLFFTNDPRRKQTYLKRLQRFLALAVQLNMNRPARAFNWAFQFTSQLIYFAQHQGQGVSRTKA